MTDATLADEVAVVVGGGDDDVVCRMAFAVIQNWSMEAICIDPVCVPDKGFRGINDRVASLEGFVKEIGVLAASRWGACPQRFIQQTDCGIVQKRRSDCRIGSGANRPRGHRFPAERVEPFPIELAALKPSAKPTIILEFNL